MKVIKSTFVEGSERAVKGREAEDAVQRLLALKGLYFRNLWEYAKEDHGKSWEETVCFTKKYGDLGISIGSIPFSIEVMEEGWRCKNTYVLNKSKVSFGRYPWYGLYRRSGTVSFVPREDAHRYVRRQSWFPSQEPDGEDFKVIRPYEIPQTISLDEFVEIVKSMLVFSTLTSSSV